MKYENVKSLVLFLLVAASGVLTWSLWTYQPKYDVVNNKYVHEVSVSEQRDATDLIKPIRVLFHIDDLHYGTVIDNEIDSIMEEMSHWNFYDIGDARIVNDQQMAEISHSNNRIELSYPDLLPFELYKGIVHVETENLPKASFDRISINIATNTEDDALIYFLNSKENIVYEGHVNRERIAELLSKVNYKRFDEYEAYPITSERNVFLPAKETSLYTYQYLPDYIDPEKFKNALFGDPTVVRRDMKANGEQFTDDRSMMNVDYTTNMIFYINPIQEPGGNQPNLHPDLLKRSIDFVNEHSGWTDNYRYFGFDAYRQRTIFRMFCNSYPVFNEEGMAEIRQHWGANEIYRYQRPYFSLDIDISTDRDPVILPSGESALNQLLNEDEIDVNMIEDLLIGYRLRKDPNKSKVLILEPSWYYLYGGSWIRLRSEDIGGDLNGLE
ncbi:two-component system activity regulator YycH [Bacillus sp. FJAT-50079]|uniref:YycH family regulatory protein n=1 Tax=Bacillus sp. FJAT-50079 TaxID=2833577 RepID=UPI001BCA0F12|nr:hypothetical protein [Bacillus sp. FJAT-50079]